MNAAATFRRLALIQCLLGVIVFCVATASPGLMLIAGGLIVMSRFLVEGPNSKPLSQWWIVPGALAALVWLLYTLRSEGTHVVVAAGHFTMWLQVLLLYGKKTNREYAELLVLSLMQMVAASVLTMSFLFAIVLTSYGLMMIMTALVFQLKIAADFVSSARSSAAPSGTTAREPLAVSGAGDRWQLRLTAAGVALASAVIAAVVFIALPRADNSRSNNEDDSRPFPGQPRAGIASEVRLGEPPPTLNNPEIAAHARFSIDGTRHDGNRRFRLRVGALDFYDRTNRRWRRSQPSEQPVATLSIPPNGADLSFLEPNESTLEADITLVNWKHQELPSLFPPSWIAGKSFNVVTIGLRDQQVMLSSVPPAATEYRIRAPINPPAAFFFRYGRNTGAGLPRSAEGEYWQLLTRKIADEFSRGTIDETQPPRGRRRIDDTVFGDYAKGWTLAIDEIRPLALDVIRTSGLDRQIDAPASKSDDRIGRALADYLQQNFRYTLTNDPAPPPREPLLEFLFDHKQGHCELFASGLAAMARSIGMRARVVTGFVVSEYNKIGGYYVIRQNDAHAWTEIYCGPDLGWRTFDSTPPGAIEQEHNTQRHALTAAREIYEHIQFAWLRSILTYDKRTRQAVWEFITGASTNAASNLDRMIDALVSPIVRLLRIEPRYRDTSAVLIVVAGALVGGLVLRARGLALWRRRQRSSLLLDRLDPKQRREIEVQLDFYILALAALERRGITRPNWQSPMAFAHAIAQAHPRSQSAILDLTDLFYQVRFGYRTLSDEQLHRANLLARTLDQLLV